MFKIALMIALLFTAFVSFGQTTTVNSKGFEKIYPNSRADSTKPLIIVDSTKYNGNLYAINPHDVKSIIILKDSAAIKKYGPEGKNGVIIIETNPKKP